jgi:hypothetical protein
VFTIDHVFNPLVWWNQEVMYNHLIDTAAHLLKEYGHKYLGGEIGFTLVLHTWGQTIQAHPHVHFIVTGGALAHTSNGYRWKDFRRRFCDGVRALWQSGSLSTQQGSLDVADMLLQAQGKKWEVYIQAPLYGVDKLLEYLGRYIFRIAISNHRIVAVEHDQVTFTYYDNREVRSQERKPKQMTLPVLELWIASWQLSCQTAAGTSSPGVACHTPGGASVEIVGLAEEDLADRAGSTSMSGLPKGSVDPCPPGGSDVRDTGQLSCLGGNSDAMEHGNCLTSVGGASPVMGRSSCT